MMRSETKTIYGVDVLGMIAMFKQLRKWRTIRKLRNRWNQSRRDLVTCRKFRRLNHHADHFQVQQRYKHMREYVKSHQQRGAIWWLTYRASLVVVLQHSWFICLSAKLQKKI
nr:hypothetical protein [Providencia rettgeri]